MEKIKAICVSNTYKNDILDDCRITPFTIGKVYELTIVGDSKPVWVSYDEDGHGSVSGSVLYPMSLFKPLNEHREEILNKLLCQSSLCN
jgi:hypothetical protein